jgi:hypothetical protein
VWAEINKPVQDAIPTNNDNATNDSIPVAEGPTAAPQPMATQPVPDTNPTNIDNNMAIMATQLAAAPAINDDSQGLQDNNNNNNNIDVAPVVVSTPYWA